MLLAKKYIIKNFNKSFFTIFITLFAISSISILIKTADISASIGLEFIDFVKIYSYLLPLSIFYIFPIVFFISACVSLSKMSLDSEILVMFSLGMKNRSLYFIYFFYSLLFSLMLLVISLGIVPIASHTKENFISYKSLSKGINLSNSSEFGQKLGDWFIFVNKDDKNNFSNIVLFRNSQNQEDIIVAKKVHIEDVSSIELSNGRAFNITKNSITNLSYEKMFISNPLNASKKHYTSLEHYWSDIFTNNAKLSKFITYILFSIFPILSIHGILAIGLLKPRISRKRVVLNASIFILFYIILVKSTLVYGWGALFILPIFWICFSYFLYYLRTNNHIDI